MQKSRSARNFFIASLVYLLLGLLVQTIAGFDVWLGFNPLAYTTVTITGQILLLGWLTQLALAVVYDYWLGSVKADDRAGITILILFNLGLPFVIIGQPGMVLFGKAWLGLVVALGSLLQLFAGIVFVKEIWDVFRVRQ